MDCGAAGWYHPTMNTVRARNARTARNEPVLYLDYDGVLHSDNVYWKPGNGIYVEKGHGSLFEHADILVDALAKWPDLGIVLSTSWVPTLGFSAARERLPEALRGRVIGATWHSLFNQDPDMRAWWDAATRYETILADIARRGPKAWLAIDDTDLGWATTARKHLVHTHSEHGLRQCREDLVRGLEALHAGELDVVQDTLDVPALVMQRLYHRGW